MTQLKRKGIAQVYLAYVDDSGVTDDRCQFGVFAAVLIHDTEIRSHEAFAGSTLADLVGENRFDEFPEFHARSLFKGTDQFQGLDEDERMRAIHNVLVHVRLEPDKEDYTAVVFGAVDKHALKGTLIASVDPADVAFRSCLLGIEQYLGSDEGKKISRDYYEESEAVILIVDDTGDQKLKDRLRKTFRQLRGRRTRHDQNLDVVHPGQLKHFHDDFYFGHSSDSIGLQIADMCAYFIGLHLRGEPSAEQFYSLFKDSIRFSSVFPSHEMTAKL